MNRVDIGILAVMFLSALMGVMRGFTREVLGLLSWLAAGFTAFFTLPFLRPVVISYIQNPIIADLLSGVTLFIVFLVLFSFISQTFTSLVRQIGLGGVDRSLGFGYGLVRGFALICLVEIFIGAFVNRKNYPTLIRDSHLSSAIYQGSDFLFPFLPLSAQNLIHYHRQTHRNSSDSSSSLPSSLPSSSTVLTEIIKSQIQHGAQVIIPPNLSNQSPPPSIHKGSSSEKKQKDDTTANQETVEELAHLKPKAQTPLSHNTTYSKQQQREMDRLLLNQEEDIDLEETNPNRIHEPEETF